MSIPNTLGLRQIASYGSAVLRKSVSETPCKSKFPLIKREVLSKGVSCKAVRESSTTPLVDSTALLVETTISPIDLNDVLKPAVSSNFDNSEWEPRGEIFEYTSAANPTLVPIPVEGLIASEHLAGPSRIVTLDLSSKIGISEYPATSPNLLASFLRVCEGESLTTESCATSQAFYVIHGRGSTCTTSGEISWKTGDLFVVPNTDERGVCTHTCLDDDVEKSGGAGIYWISDAPLLSYLGVAPRVKKFDATFFSREILLKSVEQVRHEPGATHRNRMGILLGNKATPQTKTLSHTLWSLLNVLPAGDFQKPHRHNSVALDLAVYAAPGTYTLMGKELDTEGNIINPLRVDWTTGSMFVTPPSWWHSHHNESGEEAWVLPMQDAGLYTHQRTLDIRFVDDEIIMHKAGRIK